MLNNNNKQDKVNCASLYWCEVFGGFVWCFGYFFTVLLLHEFKHLKTRQERGPESVPSVMTQSSLMIPSLVSTSTTRAKHGTARQCKIKTLSHLPNDKRRCGKLPEYVLNEDEEWERIPCLHYNIHWIHESCNISFSLEMIFGLF